MSFRTWKRLAALGLQPGGNGGSSTSSTPRGCLLNPASRAPSTIGDDLAADWEDLARSLPAVLCHLNVQVTIDTFPVTAYPKPLF